MLANERQYKIQLLLKKNGAVSTSSLVTQLGVSIETIRRDFLVMEQQGLLKRVHGGAVSTGSMKSYSDLSQRNKEHNEQKRELAAFAAGFINEGDYIALDTGSTAIFLAEREGEAIGFAQCQLRRDYVEGTCSSPVGYLEGIFVREEYRTRGVAKQLLAECEAWAGNLGCTEFASDCELTNYESFRFHLALGFLEANLIICFTKQFGEKK